MNGLPGSIFTQSAYCNAPAFFNLANNAAINGTLKVPALATAKDGQTCPTVRNFAIVDQDQSDDLRLSTWSRRATYPSSQRRTRPNHPSLGASAAIPVTTGSPDAFVDPAIGCKPWTAPDLADPGSMVPALALNELSARMGQVAPVALVPGGDTMTLLNGNVSLNEAEPLSPGRRPRRSPIRTETSIPADIVASCCAWLRNGCWPIRGR